MVRSEFHLEKNDKARRKLVSFNTAVNFKINMENQGNFERWGGGTLNVSVFSFGTLS